MSQARNEDRERDIEERAEEIEPGSAAKLEESRRAIDEASGAAAQAASADITDNEMMAEFDPSDSGAAGAADEEIDEVAEQDANEGKAAAAEQRSRAADEQEREADESAAERDEAFVVQDEGMTDAEAEEAGRETPTEGNVGGETGGDIGGRP